MERFILFALSFVLSACSVTGDDSFVFAKYECPSGFDCMYQNSCASASGVECPSTFFCGFKDKKFVSKPCKQGEYCPTTSLHTECPKGYYCPEGSTAPIKCGALSLCGLSAKYPISFLFLVFAAILFTVFNVLWYKLLVTSTGPTILPKDDTQMIVRRKSSKKLLSKKPFEINFKFENIRWSYQGRQILRGVSGSVKAGEMLAIMGPSGAGKSTLVNCILGKLAPESGTISINGYKDDIMLANLTVRENLLHSANTRTSPEMKSNLKVDDRVDAVLCALGLEHVQHSIVGDIRKRGLSGGEKKRVSIAMELVAKPSALILDEPTTGLDAASAEVIVDQLRFFANAGRTIICILHQPRARIFEQFDKVLMLTGGKSGGELCYFGSPHDVRPFLALQQLPCPEGKNPADHLIDVASGRFQCPEVPQAQFCSEADFEVYSEGKDPRRETNGQLESWCKQLYFQWLRACRQQLRDFSAIYLYCILVVGMIASLASGFSPIIQKNLSIVYNPPLGKNLRQFCPPHVKSCSDALMTGPLQQLMFFFNMAIGSIGMVCSARTFGDDDKLVLIRESGVGLSRSAYIVGKMIADFNVTLLLSLLVSGLWLIMGFPGGDWRWFSISFALLFASYGWGYFIAPIVPSNLSMTASMVMACFLSTLNGVNPKLVDVSWPWKLFWNIGYSRWISEAIYSTFTKHNRDSGSPVQFAASTIGYEISDEQFQIDIIAVILQGCVLRILAGAFIGHFTR